MPKLGPASHVALAHAAHEVRPHGFQAVACQHLDAVFHRVAGGQHVGVDVGTELPDPVQRCAAHASTSRGSAIRPLRADAATV